MSWQQVPIGGGGFSGQMVIATDGTVYLGTNVGGAYRYNRVTQRWVPITDTIGLTNGGGDMGVGDIALDPLTAGKLWVYLGTNGLVGDMFVSTDSGATWTRRTPAGLLCDANAEGGHFNVGRGPKVACDPNRTQTVYIASDNIGLQGTSNDGVSWDRATGVPTDSVQGQSFVVLDKNGGTISGYTAILYVGILDFTGTDTNAGVWKSTDAGITWTKMTMSPTTPFRAGVADDGTLYVTAIQNGTTLGGVFKAARSATSMTNITPSDPLKSYGPLTVDPTVGAQTLIAGQMNQALDYRLPAYRSTDGGATWAQPNLIVDSDPVLPTRLTGDNFQGLGVLVTNPANTQEVWGADANNAFMTPNINNTAQHWISIYAGHEETFPLVPISCPAPFAAKVMCGSLDFVGFRWTDPTQYPTSMAFNSTPLSFGDGQGLDFCESNPNIVVRVSHDFTGGNNWGYKSTNNGATWTAFGGYPPTPAPGGGRIAISGGNSQNLVWLLENGLVYFSTNGGTTWTAATNAPYLPVAEFSFLQNPLCADRVSSNTFYMLVPGSGVMTLWASTDGGNNWTSRGTITGPTPNRWKIIADPLVAGKLWADIDTAVGVWKSSNGGSTWTQVGSIASQGAIAFGFPALGHTNSSVAIYAGIGATTQAYVSPDDGVTWAPIANIPPIDPNVLISFAADRQTYGRVYVGTLGRGLFVGNL